MLRFLLNGLYSSQRNNELPLYYQGFHSEKYILEYWSGNDVIFVRYIFRKRHMCVQIKGGRSTDLREIYCLGIGEMASRNAKNKKSGKIGHLERT